MSFVEWFFFPPEIRSSLSPHPTCPQNLRVNQGNTKHVCVSDPSIVVSKSKGKLAYLQKVYVEAGS